MIPTPEAVRASEAFEQFVQNSQIVLIQQLQLWREANKVFQEPFEKQVLRNYAKISEDVWIDRILVLNKKSDTPPFYPCLFPHGVCATATSPMGMELASKFYAMVIHDDPILLIGLLNPFLSHEIYKQLSYTRQHEKAVFVSITPHQFQDYVAKQCKMQVIQKVDWSNYSGSEWANRGELNGAMFPTASGLVESFWTGQPMQPIVYPFMFLSAACKSKPFHFAIRKTVNQIWIATDSPTETFRDDLYQIYAGKEIYLLAIPPEECIRLAKAVEEEKRSEGFSLDIDVSEPLVVRSWPLERCEPPVVWNMMLHRAITIGASDITLEPNLKNTRVRFKVDGAHIEQAPLRKDFYEEMSIRVKVVGKMESTLKGVDQTGSGHTVLNGITYDQRYSIASGMGGLERIVARIHSSHIPSLEDLRLPPKESDVLNWFLNLSRGMLICTGPTGSGKSTTLYACLTHLTKASKSILTIEDPVEKRLPDIYQISIRPKAGITFESALRTAVRQAPDIIMVGEIRDKESAITAFDAASTGHLILTTLHTNDAPGTIDRLAGPRFQIDKNTMALALRLIINQALVPRLCPACRVVRRATHHDTLRFPDVEVTEPRIAEKRGCTLCRGTGIQGRIVLMELMPVDILMQAQLEAGASAQKLREFNNQRGFLNLSKQATRHMLDGEIEVSAAAAFLNQAITVSAS